MDSKVGGMVVTIGCQAWSKGGSNLELTLLVVDDIYALGKETGVGGRPVNFGALRKERAVTK